MQEAVLCARLSEQSQFQARLTPLADPCARRAAAGDSWMWLPLLRRACSTAMAATSPWGSPTAAAAGHVEQRQRQRQQLERQARRAAALCRAAPTASPCSASTATPSFTNSCTTAQAASACRHSWLPLRVTTDVPALLRPLRRRPFETNCAALSNALSPDTSHSVPGVLSGQLHERNQPHQLTRGQQQCAWDRQVTRQWRQCSGHKIRKRTAPTRTGSFKSRHAQKQRGAFRRMEQEGATAGAAAALITLQGGLVPAPAVLRCAVPAGSS